MPLVSVIMSVFNGEKTLVKSVESILNQSFQDFEFIIVDDGSNDQTSQILKSYNDKRLVIISQENQGLTKSLNIAIKHSSGKFLARQDVDDYSFPERLEKQIDIFNNNQKLNLVGTRALLKMENRIVESKIIDNSDILNLLKKNNIFIHSSVMIKKNVFKNINYYNENFKLSQDYEAWLKLMDLGYGNFFVINEILIERNIDKNTISRKNFFQQSLNGFKLRKKRISFFLNLYLFIYQYLTNLIPVNIILKIKNIFVWQR